MKVTRAEIEAEASKVAEESIRVSYWYVTAEQAQALIYRAIQDGADPARISSSEGLNIEVYAFIDGKHFRKIARISPASCVARVSGLKNVIGEAVYLARKRVQELKRDVAFHRLVAA